METKQIEFKHSLYISPQDSDTMIEKARELFTKNPWVFGKTRYSNSFNNYLVPVDKCEEQNNRNQLYIDAYTWELELRDRQRNVTISKKLEEFMVNKSFKDILLSYYLRNDGQFVRHSIKSELENREIDINQMKQELQTYLNENYRDHFIKDKEYGLKIWTKKRDEFEEKLKGGHYLSCQRKDLMAERLKFRKLVDNVDKVTHINIMRTAAEKLYYLQMCEKIQEEKRTEITRFLTGWGSKQLDKWRTNQAQLSA